MLLNFAGLLLFALFVMLWQLIALLELISTLYLPRPTAIVNSLASLVASGRVWSPLQMTIQHMIYGWVSACLLGGAMGALIALSESGRKLFEPTLDFMRPLPSAAMLPAFIMIIGLNDTMVVAVIIFGTIWPILLGTIHGMTSVDSRLIEAARVMGLNYRSQLIEIRIPSALPQFLAAARIALSLSLILAIVTEMASGVGGLGNVVLRAARNYQSADVFAGIAVIAALGLVTTAAIEVIESRVLFQHKN